MIRGWRSDMMIINPEVFVQSPNRYEPHATQSAVEVIANTIEKIPEVGVKFEGDTVFFKTSYNARIQDAAQVALDFGDKMDEIANIVKKNLVARGYSQAKLTKINIDVDPGQWRPAGSGLQNRQAVYTVVGSYTLEV